MQKNQSFITGRLFSFYYAFKGAWVLITTEHATMVQFAAAIVITIMGFVFDITATEWALQTLAIGMVMGSEGLNTALEKISDFIHPDYHEKIGLIKDVAAGAVFIVAICAFVVGCLIYIPKIF